MVAPARLFQIAGVAAFEMDAAFDWYERRQAGLGDQFLTACNEAFSQISRNPAAFPVLHGSVRRAFLRRFPFGVFFDTSGDNVIILGVIHARRSPDVWP